MKAIFYFCKRLCWVLAFFWILKIHSQPLETIQPPKKQTENQAVSEETLSRDNKDEVLEELKLFNQGIDTKESLKQALKTKESAPLDKVPTPTAENSKKTTAVKKPLDDSQKTSIQPLKKPPIDHFQQQLNQINQEKKQKFDLKPTRKQFKKLFQDYQNLIENHPREQSIYWSLFDLIHQYIKRVKDSLLYEPELAQQALALLNDIADKFGESGKTALYLCQYLIANNFYPEGLKQCSKAIKWVPDDPTAHLLQFQHSQNKNKKNLLKILKQFPKNDHVLLFVGLYFKEQKKYDWSEKYMKKALKFNPQFIPALLGLAELLFQKGQYETAFSYYSQACQQNYLKTNQLFRKAKSTLSQKSLFKEANKYQSGINACVNSQTDIPK